MKKKVLSMVLVIVTLLSTMSVVVSAKDIQVKINEKLISFDVPPQIINDRTMVPMRAIFEAFNYKVNWTQSTQTITANGSQGTVVMRINSNYIEKNNNSTYIDVAPVIIDGRTLVPVRAISESLGCEVDWDGNKKIVSITMQEEKNLTSNSNTNKIVSIENMSNISGESFYNVEREKLVDNYGNTYSNALYSFENYTFQTILNKEYSRFKCTLYVSKGCSSDDTTRIIIKSDGKTIYTSPIITKKSKPIKVDVDITGCNDFQMKVETNGWHEVGYIADAEFYK